MGRKENQVREFITRRPEHSRFRKDKANPTPRSNYETNLPRTPRHRMTPKQIMEAAKVLEHGLWDRYSGVNSAFARDIGVTHQATMFWLRCGVVPADRVMDVCDAMYHEAVIPETLRPDIYREARLRGPLVPTGYRWDGKKAVRQESDAA